VIIENLNDFEQEEKYFFALKIIKWILFESNNYFYMGKIKFILFFPEIYYWLVGATRFIRLPTFYISVEHDFTLFVNILSDLGL